MEARWAIRAETRITLPMFRAFNWFTQFHSKYYRIYRALAAFLIPLLCVVLLITRFMPFGAGLTMFFALTFWFAHRKTNQAFEHTRTIFESGYTYEFSDEKLIARSEGAVSSDTQEILYDGLYKAFETADMFYLYIGPLQGYILPKASFTQGTADDLRALLREKLNKRFVVCW